MVFFVRIYFLCDFFNSNLIGVLLAKPVSAKFGKKNTFMGTMILAVIFSVAFYWVHPNDVELTFGLNIIIGITAGIVLPLSLF
ncbi:MFS transporter [uncultured Lutibacter sp.]|uniref:MFS transporter n=1 Tax=uncultured Lutibacter sp. TaxID=437739 RepID=UPI0026217AE2|nr:MFS transporter [uncultured Lutibacter sp.]